MTDPKRDFRKIGGPRVTAPFSMVVANSDPFNMYSDRFSGSIVFNVRGGCLFIENAVLAKAQARIFADGPIALLNSLELTDPDNQTILLEKISIKLSREKNVNGAHGIVFKFVQTSEAHIDLLNLLLDKLHPADNDENVVHPPLKKAA